MRCNQLKIHQFAHTSEKPFKLVNLCSANNFFYILCIVLTAKWAKQISKWLTNKLNSILQCMQGWQKAKIRGLRLLAIQDPIIFFWGPKFPTYHFPTPINVNEKIMNDTLLTVDQLSMKNMIYRTLQCFKQKFFRKMPWRERLFF